MKIEKKLIEELQKMFEEYDIIMEKREQKQIDKDKSNMKKRSTTDTNMNGFLCRMRRVG